MHSISPFIQLEHGDLLLHRTLRRRQVTQLRKLAGSCVDCEEVVVGVAAGRLDGGSEGWVGKGVKAYWGREGSIDWAEPLGAKDMTGRHGEKRSKNERRQKRREMLGVINH